MTMSWPPSDRERTRKTRLDETGFVPLANSCALVVTAATLAGIGDGIAGWWRLLYFGNGLEVTPLSAPDADPDGDSSIAEAAEPATLLDRTRKS